MHRRFQRLAVVAVVFLITYFWLGQTGFTLQDARWQALKYIPSSFDWGRRPLAHPVDESTMTRLPEGIPHTLPRIQHDFSRGELSKTHNQTQSRRRDAVRDAARRSWKTYRDHAWGRDEVSPRTLTGKDTFAGWGATLVDSMDMLWIMDMKEEFRDAVRYVATIDWNKATSQHCSLFETNIRYLGGLLSAYDLSQEQVLLAKAIELGDMLYTGFDTPNHMPANAFDFDAAKEGKLALNPKESSAAAGSLSLEFTRLSQLTGNPKYYNAIDGIKKALERTQDSTNLPGMWPIYVDLEDNFSTLKETSFSLGAASDSAYEYLSKMYALLGGLDPAYQKLHTKAMATIQKHILFRPMLPEASPAPTPDILFPGLVLSNGRIIELVPEVQHLGCFAGGMFALGGRLFDQPEHVTIGEQLARGCAWAYGAFPTGIMPEVAHAVPCRKPQDVDKDKRREDFDNLAPCAWNETLWMEKARGKGRRDGGAPKTKPFSAVRNPVYFLRPEAIESVFILYRVTGKADLLDIAWRMFEAITAATRTEYAYSAINDVQAAGYTVKLDSMESFWIAETLKYFYLIFSEPELISLDDYVFNTEAHPLRLPKPGIP